MSKYRIILWRGPNSDPIRTYLHRFILWWTNTTKIWSYAELMMQFIKVCDDIKPIAIADRLLCRYFSKSHNRIDYVLGPVDELVADCFGE